MAEGAPLLREYRVKSLIEGSNPSLSARTKKATHRVAFLVLEERSELDENPRFDKTAGLPFCTAKPPSRGEGNGRKLLLRFRR